MKPARELLTGFLDHPALYGGQLDSIELGCRPPRKTRRGRQRWREGISGIFKRRTETLFLGCCGLDSFAVPVQRGGLRWGERAGAVGRQDPGEQTGERAGRQRDHN